MWFRPATTRIEQRAYSLSSAWAVAATVRNPWNFKALGSRVGGCLLEVAQPPALRTGKPNDLSVDLRQESSPVRPDPLSLARGGSHAGARLAQASQMGAVHQIAPAYDGTAMIAQKAVAIVPLLLDTHFPEQRHGDVAIGDACKCANQCLNHHPHQRRAGCAGICDAPSVP